jgi:hypothetical protein
MRKLPLKGFCSFDRSAHSPKESLRKARQALGPGRARSAEERGAAMSRATATEYVLMLTASCPALPAAAPARDRSGPGNENSSP